MIIRGLDNIIVYLENVHTNNLDEYYKRHRANRPHYMRGTREDVWVRGYKRDIKERKIRELEQELADIKRREQDASASHQMHLAMGCDDRDCRVC